MREQRASAIVTPYFFSGAIYGETCKIWESKILAHDLTCSQYNGYRSRIFPARSHHFSICVCVCFVKNSTLILVPCTFINTSILIYN